MGFGYGNGAFTIASHVSLIVALTLLVYRLVRLMGNGLPPVSIRRGMLAGLAIFFWGAVVERLYYVFARLLRPVGVDLWQYHPAPEVLSAMVLLTLYAFKTPMIFFLHPRERATRQVGIELASLAALWSLIAWTLY